MLVNSLIFLLSFNWQEVQNEVQVIPLVPIYCFILGVYCETCRILRSLQWQCQRL